MAAASMAGAVTAATDMDQGPSISPPLRRPAVPSAVLGVLIFIIAEVMFFSGLISAFVIARSSVGPGAWPPPGQPRLPIAATALNTAVLLLSAGVLVLSRRAFRTDGARALRLLATSMALGSFFVLSQGREWVALLRQGLTLTTSTHGAFFYVIVGCHGLHALGALIALGWALLRLRRGALLPGTFSAACLFWYFVAGIWPILYYQVYLR